MKTFVIGIGVILVAAVIMLVLRTPPAVAPTPEATPIPSPEITGKLWQWSDFTDPKEQYSTDDPENYTLILNEDGTANIKADCNAANTSYELTGGNISFGPIATTLALCPEGSRGNTFLANLEAARIWFAQDGDLYFDLQFDSGTMRFTEGAQNSTDEPSS